MKQALSLLILITALLQLGARTWDHVTMLTVGYGAISIMAIMISATFLWLWQVRATPLALGMSFSWAGSSLIMGAWWVAQITGAVHFGVEAEMMVIFLAFLATGAVLHFSVIQASFDLHGLTFLIPVGAAVLVAVASLGL